MLKKFIGDKKFYLGVLSLTLPIMIQNGITNFVNMLDNVMVGQIGTVEMTGVAIANQLIFIFNLCVFGAVSGAGIFTAQFFGGKNAKGVRDTFRFKILFCVLLTIAFMLVFFFAGKPLISLYLRGEGSAADAASSLSFSYRYLICMLVGLIPYTVTQCYSSTLRETGKTVPPMVAGIVAVFTNLVLNYCLIFGRLGFPKLGVIGAAIATVISRYVELIIVAAWTHKRRDINEFIIGAYRSLKIPLSLVKQIFVRGTPLMLNEAFWAAGIAMLNQCYSSHGLNVVAANNISQTFWNVFAVAFTAFGASIGIIIGQLLGAGDFVGAKRESYKLIAFTVFVSSIVALIYIPSAELIPSIYNTTDEIRHLATRLMQISALAMPVDACAHATYFTIRSGGKTFITFLFDSCFIWAFNVPTALILSNFTGMNILGVFAAVQGLHFVKCIVGIVLVKKGMWLKNIVE